MSASELQREDRSLEPAEVVQALTTEYNDVYGLQVNSEEFSVYRFSGKALGVIEHLRAKSGYARSVQVYIENNVFTDDRDMFSRMTEKNVIVDELRKNEVYKVHYRVFRDDELHYYYMKAVRIGAADTFEHFIIGFANEDAEMQAIVHLTESTATLKAIEFDDLTGLYTQKAFFHHAENLLKHNPDVAYNMIISDIENFKRINERYGRDKGDEILKSIAGFLPAGEHTDAVCGRYGSDQFVILARQQDLQSPDAALIRLKQILPVPGVTVKFSIYENVEHDRPVSATCDRLLVALKTIKHQYGKLYITYDETLKKRVEKQNKIEENMQRALEEHQFTVYYQPKHDLKEDKTAGAEALVRWLHPDFGFMNPGLFIPLFEQNGFIKSLDWYVWETVCQDLTGWIREKKKVVPVSVNVSRRDFEQEELAEKIIALVDRYQLDHELFHIEVTESSYAYNPEVVSDNVMKLHQAGFVIELDDFGTGYSSLTSLSSMPLDIIKLDMSLIERAVPNTGRDVLEFSVDLAKLMKLRIVQEGVETREQAERMKELGCDYIQGYYFSRPLAKAQFEEYLNNK
ncbi:MAG: bifunctional diguanylate cyclase/phosphodiesterase [Clostridiales bacterium]|nr:bifunctional diguanylate cyclase/phosphodiesterase [Candidatus Blautia equi]